MQTKRSIIWLQIVIMLIWTLIVAGCGGKTNDKVENKPQEAKKLTAGILKLTSSAPLFIGIEKGFFQEQGLELDVQWFDAAHPIAVATASNKVDVGATGITASLYNMVAGGQQLSIVADKGREQKGYSSSAILVRTDLWQQGIQSIESLKGKRIGITQTGSTYHYMIGRMLEEKGLVLADVELVPLAKLSTVMASLQSGQVDAAILNEPNISKVMSAGYGKVIIQVGDMIDYQTSGIFYSPNLMKDKDTGIRFLKAYIKSCRYYYDAVLQQQNGRPSPGQNYDEVIAIIAKYTGTPIEDIKLGLPYIDRDGKLLGTDIQTQINWYMKQNMIEKPLDAAQVTNTSLWQDALNQMK